MNPGLLFAVVAALVFALWTVFHQRAATHINNLFGAIVVSSTAVIVGLFFLIPKWKSMVFYTHPKGILFAAIAGVCALGIDFFVLKAYGTGLPISIGGPIIIGGSVALAAFIGFFLGESITLMKLFGLFLVIGGSAILSAVS